MSDAQPRFSRLQARYCGRLGAEVGVFVAVDHVRRAGKLTQDQVAAHLDVDDWFLEHLPESPFYTDGNRIGQSPGSRIRYRPTWLRASSS